MLASKIRSRISSQIKYKILLGILLTPSIDCFYLLIQRHPLFSATEMHMTYFDRMIPFLPRTVCIYDSIFLYTAIAPCLMKSRRELNRYVAGILLISSISFFIFFFFPTSVNRSGLHPLESPLYTLLIFIDNELNAFPSLHAAFAVFNALYCNRFSAILGNIAVAFLWLWGIGIIVSALCIRQHYLPDILGGILVGLAGYYFSTRDMTKESSD
jgi:membrane-associated phospholipid phosphatase